jgi:ABC-type amino acid transport substrate-binding protein
MRRKRFHPWAVALTTLSLALGATACGGDDEEEPAAGGGAAATETEQQAPAAEKYPADSTMGKIQEKGEITIGVKYDVPPFGFKNPRTNEIEGFDIDFGKAVADKLGVKPKYIEAISDNRIPFIQDGTADLILSTMTINPERAQEIGFTDPYFIARGRILQKKGGDIKGVEDLAGKRVCTVLGSTYEATLKEQAPEANLRLVDTYSECLELIQNGGVDAVSTDDVILTGMIIQDESLELVGRGADHGALRRRLQEGRQGVHEFLNGVLDEYESDGRWKASYQKWLGQYTGEEQEPPKETLEDVLKAAEEAEQS